MAFQFYKIKKARKSLAAGALPHQTQLGKLTLPTPWAIKRCHFYFYDNFGKCGPISALYLYS